MFHSLIYNRRRKCIGYFVQYSSASSINQYQFGAIELFFVCNGLCYAIIKHHPIKEQCSNLFKTSSYYDLVRKPIDSMYFILHKDGCRLDIIRIDDIKRHCLVVEKNEHLFITTILSYDEHD